MTEIPLPYGTPPQTDFDGQYRRLCEAAECVTPQELADFLGIRRSAISEARRRQALPRAWLLTLLKKKHIHPAWVRLGTDGRLTQLDAEGVLPLDLAAALESAPGLNCTTDELLTELVRRALINIR